MDLWKILEIWVRIFNYCREMLRGVELKLCVEAKGSRRPLSQIQPPPKILLSTRILPMFWKWQYLWDSWISCRFKTKRFPFAHFLDVFVSMMGLLRLMALQI